MLYELLTVWNIISAQKPIHCYLLRNAFSDSENIPDAKLGSRSTRSCIWTWSLGRISGILFSKCSTAHNSHVAVSLWKLQAAKVLNRVLNFEVKQFNLLKQLNFFLLLHIYKSLSVFYGKWFLNTKLVKGIWFLGKFTAKFQCRLYSKYWSKKILNKENNDCAKLTEIKVLLLVPTIWLLFLHYLPERVQSPDLERFPLLNLKKSFPKRTLMGMKKAAVSK